MESLDTGNFPPAQDMARKALLGAVEGEIIDEVGSHNVASVGDRGTIVTSEVASDLRKRRASCAAVSRIGGQAM